MKHHHAIAEFVADNVFADSGNYSGSFMAKDARGRMRTGGNLLEISAADAAGVDPNQDFSRTDLWDWDGLQPDVVNPAIHRRLHGCGDGLLTGPTTELGCARHVTGY